MAVSLDARAARAEELIADATLDPTAKIRALRDLQRGVRGSDRDASALKGRIARYIEGLELQRDADAMTLVFDHARAREDADVRAALLAEGVSEAELDAAGLFSHEQLDAHAEDGTLQEAVAGAFGAALNPELLRRLASRRRRGSHGQFAEEFGVPELPKGRTGKPVGTPNRPGGTRAEATARARAAAQPPTTVGVTPARPGTPDTPEVYASDMFAGFELAVDEVAAHFSVRVNGMTQVHGVFEGGGERAYAIDVTDGDVGVRGFMAELGRRYDQDAVASFRADANGPDVRYRISGVDGEAAAADAASSLGFANVVGDTLDFWGSPDDAEKVEALADRLGGSVEVTQGHATFIGKDSYGEEIDRAEQAGRADSGGEVQAKQGKGRRNDGGSREAADAAKASRQVAPASPGTYDTRREALQKRVAEKAREGVQQRPPQSPGTPADTGPTPDASAPRLAGHASQKELLAYANAAVTQPTTAETYGRRDPKTGRIVYDKSRRALHEKIIAKFLGGVPAQKEPRVFFTGGGYASGKGGVVDNHADVPPDALVLDPDKIKAEFPEFQQLLEEDPEANLLVYEEAWDVAQELQRRAIEKKVNMVVDGISDTSPEDMLNRVKLFVDAGYVKPKLVTVTIPTEEAISRAEKRARKAKKPSDRRFIPEVIMRAVHRDVSATMPGIIEGAKDLGLSIEVWNNNQGWDAENDRPVPPVPIFTFTPDGGPEVVRAELWNEFIGKADEPIPGVDAPSLQQEGAKQMDEAKLESEGPRDQIRVGDQRPTVARQSSDHGEFGAARVPEGEWVDMPFESGSSDPQPIEYADLGEEKRYDPKGDFREAQKRGGGDAAE